MPSPSSGFLQISGFCFSWSQGAPAGSRVVSVTRQLGNGSCAGAAIPADASQYTAATNSFTAAGGAGYQDFSSRLTLRGYDADVFSECGDRQYTAQPRDGTDHGESVSG